VLYVQERPQIGRIPSTRWRIQRTREGPISESDRLNASRTCRLSSLHANDIQDIAPILDNTSTFNVHVKIQDIPTIIYRILWATMSLTGAK
jgi:hypothetical protein